MFNDVRPVSWLAVVFDPVPLKAASPFVSWHWFFALVKTWDQINQQSRSDCSRGRVHFTPRPKFWHGYCFRLAVQAVEHRCLTTRSAVLPRCTASWQFVVVVVPTLPPLSDIPALLRSVHLFGTVYLFIALAYICRFTATWFCRCTTALVNSPSSKCS